MLLLFESERSTTYLPSRTGFIRALHPTQKNKNKNTIDRVLNGDEGIYIDDVCRLLLLLFCFVFHLYDIPLYIFFFITPIV